MLNRTTRTRRINRPQPPLKPRYIAVAVAGVFAIVPVGQVMSESSGRDVRQTVSSVEEAHYQALSREDEDVFTSRN
jgi:hypothetical protein